MSHHRIHRELVIHVLAYTSQDLECDNIGYTFESLGNDSYF